MPADVRSLQRDGSVAGEPQTRFREDNRTPACTASS